MRLGLSILRVCILLLAGIDFGLAIDHFMEGKYIFCGIDLMLSIWFLHYALIE